jgi:hypothetical protein
MDDLGGITDEILAAQIEILAENEVSDSGEETVGDDSDDDESFCGRGTPKPAATEFKAGARIVYLGQEGDEMILGYVVAVHGDGKGGPPLYTSYLEGFGGKQVEGHRHFPVAVRDGQPPPVSAPVPSHSSYRASQSRKDKKEKKEYIKQMSEMAKIVKQQRLKNKKIDFFQMLKDTLSRCLKLSVSNKRTLLQTLATNLSRQRSLGIITQSPEEEDLKVLGYMLT